VKQNLFAFETKIVNQIYGKEFAEINKENDIEKRLNIL
jgi:hypothetical protein